MKQTTEGLLVEKLGLKLLTLQTKDKSDEHRDR
jgi:hypothetical protein